MTADVTPASPQGAPAALLNGLAILETFTLAHPARTVTEIADMVGLHKSTVSRMLNGLAEAGYVRREGEQGRYRLGLSVLQLAAPLLADLDPRAAALPQLEFLQESTLETAALALWNGRNAVAVEQIPSPHQVRHTASIGTLYTKWESSCVRVLLAHFDTDFALQLYREGAIVATSALDEAQVEANRREVMGRGYAINDGLTTPEEFGAAAPIYDTDGMVIGCVMVSAPRSRVHHQSSAAELVAAVRQAADATTQRLGRSK